MPEDHLILRIRNADLAFGYSRKFRVASLSCYFLARRRGSGEKVSLHNFKYDYGLTDFTTSKYDYDLSLVASAIKSAKRPVASLAVCGQRMIMGSEVP